MTANTEQWTGIHRHHYVIGILLHIQRKINLIDDWSNRTIDRHTQTSLSDKNFITHSTQNKID